MMTAQHRRQLVAAKAEIAALKAGVPPDRSERFVRTLNLDTVEVTDDGRVDEAIVAQLIAEGAEGRARVRRRRPDPQDTRRPRGQGRPRPRAPTSTSPAAARPVRRDDHPRPTVTR